MITTGLLSRNDPAARPTLYTAANLGIPYFKIGYYKFKDVSKLDSYLAQVKSDVESLAAIAQHAGISGGFHNHSGAYVGSSLWDHWWVLRDTDPAAVGFYYDPCHATIEGGDAGWEIGFHRLQSKLKMVACKDFFWEKVNGKWDATMCPLGQGMVNYPKFFKMLEASGFSGPISLHVEYKIEAPTESQRIEGNGRNRTGLQISKVAVPGRLRRLRCLPGAPPSVWLRPLAVAATCAALWLALDTTPAQIRKDSTWSPRLLLSIIDAESGEPTAARVSLEVDGWSHDPGWLGSHGLRFVSVHISKRQSQVVVYARGSGPLEIPLTPDAKSARIHVVKGFDYVPVSVDVDVEGDRTPIEVRLQRWNRFHERGWRAADAHLHYDRNEPTADRDWFDMLDADGLSHAQFMVLKGGMVPGIWARQFAYGNAGVGTDGVRTIIPGEEYRDGLQGHTLLFGLNEIIQPIMAGRPDAPYTSPRFMMCCCGLVSLAECPASRTAVRMAMV